MMFKTYHLNISMAEHVIEKIFFGKFTHTKKEACKFSYKIFDDSIDKIITVAYYS